MRPNVFCTVVAASRSQHQCAPAWLMQWGPSASWPVVLVPIGGPWTREPVSTMKLLPPSTWAAKRSMPRGAGPPRFSPTRLYCEPWQGHSNHWEVTQLRHPAAEVRTGLPQGHQAGPHAGQHGGRVDQLGLRQLVDGVLGDPHPALGHVQEAVRGLDARLDVVGLADVDLRTEPSARGGPQEGDAGRAEGREAEHHEADDRAVEELAPGDAERLGVGRHVDGGGRRADGLDRAAGADALERHRALVGAPPQGRLLVRLGRARARRRCGPACGSRGTARRWRRPCRGGGRRPAAGGRPARRRRRWR